MRTQPQRGPAVSGLLDIWPLAVPAVPFGLVLGVAVVESSVPNFVGWLGSSLIFGGAAQLTVVSLLGAGAAALAAIGGGLVVNARHVMYSAAMAPKFGPQPWWFRLLGPYFLIDQMFAISVNREEEPAWFRRYYLAAAVSIWVLWQVVVAVGIFVGPVLPEAWELEFAVPVVFVGLVALVLDRRPAVYAAIAAVFAAALSSSLPSGSGLLVGAGVGIIVGTVTDKGQP